jgi:hypothetical protein
MSATIINRPVELLTADRLLNEAVAILENEIDPATDAIERSISNLAIVLFMVMRETIRNGGLEMLMNEIAESGGRVLKSPEQTLVFFVIAGRTSRQHLLIRYGTIAVLELLNRHRGEFADASRDVIMARIEQWGSVDGIITTRRRQRRQRAAENAASAEQRRRIVGQQALDQAAQQAGVDAETYIDALRRDQIVADMRGYGTKIIEQMPLLIAEGAVTEVSKRRFLTGTDVFITFGGKTWLLNRQ